MDQTHATETHLEETKPNPRKKILLLCCLVAAILVWHTAFCAAWPEEGLFIPMLPSAG